jgi:FAD:protein FMN transferase
LNEIKRMRPTLGTFVEIYAQSAHAELECIIEDAYQEIYKINDLLSFHDENSELTKLNLSAGEKVILNPTTINVLRLAKAMTIASNGYFNCTVGGALVKKGALPSHGLTSYLIQGAASDLEIIGRSVRLKRRVLITLDGIAKGYAVDCAVNVMKNHGISAGWVNAGGDIKVFGDIVMPLQRRELDGGYSLLGGLKESAMATSAVNPTLDKTFPSWIVGKDQPPEVGVWTILAKQAWRADALTKVACNASDNERKQLIESLGGVLV